MSFGGRQKLNGISLGRKFQKKIALEITTSVKFN